MTSDYEAKRAELLAKHADARRRRNAAEIGSKAHIEAIDEVGRIEVALAKLGREQDPPLV